MNRSAVNCYSLISGKKCLCSAYKKQKCHDVTKQTVVERTQGRAPMNTEFKIALYMNIMFNLLLAVILSIVAQILSQGGVQFPAIILDIIIAFVLEMFIGMCLPFSRWGMALGNKYAEPGSIKQRIISTTIIAIPFAVLMCLSMSFIGSVLIAHLPLSVWFQGALALLPIFIALGWIFAFLFIPFFMGIARKMVLGE